jgi:hypothetical protein
MDGLMREVAINFEGKHRLRRGAQLECHSPTACHKMAGGNPR